MMMPNFNFVSLKYVSICAPKMGFHSFVALLSTNTSPFTFKSSRNGVPSCFPLYKIGNCNPATHQFFHQCLFIYGLNQSRTAKFAMNFNGTINNDFADFIFVHLRKMHFLCVSASLRLCVKTSCLTTPPRPAARHLPKIPGSRRHPCS
jgi:hypothetical protein